MALLTVPGSRHAPKPPYKMRASAPKRDVCEDK